jgi:hypothetical protein
MDLRVTDVLGFRQELFLQFTTITSFYTNDRFRQRLASAFLFTPLISYLCDNNYFFRSYLIALYSKPISIRVTEILYFQQRILRVSDHNNFNSKTIPNYTFFIRFKDFFSRLP